MCRYANQWQNNDASKGGKGGNDWGKGGNDWNSKGGGKSGPYDSKGSWSKDGNFGKGKADGKGKSSSFQVVRQAAMATFKQSLGDNLKVPDDQQVYLSGLPPDTTDEGLYQLCAPFGAIGPI